MHLLTPMSTSSYRSVGQLPKRQTFVKSEISWDHSRTTGIMWTRGSHVIWLQLGLMSAKHGIRKMLFLPLWPKIRLTLVACPSPSPRKYLDFPLGGLFSIFYGPRLIKSCIHSHRKWGGVIHSPEASRRRGRGKLALRSSRHWSDALRV